MHQSSSASLGIITNLLLSIVLMNWLTCKQEVMFGAFISLAFFTASTTGWMLFIHHHAHPPTKQNVANEATENIQIATLKEQLKSCLQYGDTEQADEISQKLVALTGDGKSDSTT
jgi:uncharacterized protein YpmS